MDKIYWTPDFLFLVRQTRHEHADSEATNLTLPQSESARTTLELTILTSFTLLWIWNTWVWIMSLYLVRFIPSTWSWTSLSAMWPANWDAISASRATSLDVSEFSFSRVSSIVPKNGYSWEGKPRCVRKDSSQDETCFNHFTSLSWVLITRWKIDLFDWKYKITYRITRGEPERDWGDAREGEERICSVIHLQIFIPGKQTHKR